MKSKKSQKKSPKSQSSKRSKQQVKVFRNSDYEIIFNLDTGFELLQGINGKPDPFALDLPSLLDIGIMGRCHNKCEFCYQGHEKKKHMRFDNFKRIVDQVKTHTNQIALGGRGDPNHHPRFKDIVEYSRKNFVVPNYTTSGFKMKPEHVEISKMCGAVAVSDYERSFSYEAMEALYNNGIKTNIHMIFDRINYDKTIKILYGNNVWKSKQNARFFNGKEQLIDINKINAVIFLLFKRAGAAADVKRTPTSYQIQAFSSLVFNPKSNFKIGMDSCLVNHAIKYGNPHEMQRLTIDTCEAARMSAYISPDMIIMPCSFADEKKWGVPIGKKSIHTIWNKSKPFKKFREILKKNPNCCPLNL